MLTVCFWWLGRGGEEFFFHGSTGSLSLFSLCVSHLRGKEGKRKRSLPPSLSRALLWLLGWGGSHHRDGEEFHPQENE